LQKHVPELQLLEAIETAASAAAGKKCLLQLQLTLLGVLVMLQQQPAVP